MSSSGSISKGLSVTSTGVLLGLMLAGGCATRPAAAPPRTVYGYADLTALVHHQPGWGGLSQYDAALARLQAVSQNLPAAGQPDPKMATLPALPPGSARDSAPSGAAVSGIAQHLGLIEGTLVGNLDDRRKLARADQLRRQQELWRREARRLFPVPARTAEISSDLTLQLLEANVTALTRTLDHWDNSKKPAPALDQLRLNVEADRRHLESLIAVRIQTREAARTAREAALQHLRQARLDYVQSQGDSLTARLEADDARLLAAQKQRLSVQKQGLLAALARPEPVAVPAVGEAGALTLPSGPEAARASLSAASLRSARTTLLAQRARWIHYVYEDTRASALDAAGQRHWNITFGPPRRGDKDLTADLERALTKG